MVSLCADVMDHLKVIGEKPCTHSLRNIDFIYMINLDERPEKYALALNKLAPYHIVPYRFSAVNGWELSLETLNDVGVRFGPWMDDQLWGTCYLPEDEGMALHEPMNRVGRNYFSHCMSRGAVGIVLSHLSILQDAYDAGYKTIWVLEDDIDILADPTVLCDRIDELDALVGEGEWDILFTDTDTKGNDGKRVYCTSYARRPNFTPSNVERFRQKTVLNPHFRWVGARYGAYSMLIRRSGMQKLLNFIRKYQIFLPFDMEYTQPDDIHLYTLLEDVVTTQIKAPSDNGAPNYRNRE